MKMRTTVVSVMLAVATIAITAPPGQAEGMVKCDEASGVGKEEVECKLTCTPGDEVSARVEMTNGDDSRGLDVGVDCGNAFDENSCSDETSCEASDDYTDDEPDARDGECYGSGDEEWNDKFWLDLWCNASGGSEWMLGYMADQTMSAASGPSLPTTCAEVEALAADATVELSSFVHASAGVVDGVVTVAGIAWNGGACEVIQPTLDIDGEHFTLSV